MCDEAMDDIVPLVVPANYLRVNLIPRERRNLADEVKVCSRQSDPGSSSCIVRKDYQQIKNLVVRRITEVASGVAVIEACPGLSQ